MRLPYAFTEIPSSKAREARPVRTFDNSCLKASILFSILSSISANTSSLICSSPACISSAIGSNRDQGSYLFSTNGLQDIPLFIHIQNQNGFIIIPGQGNTGGI